MIAKGNVPKPTWHPTATLQRAVPLASEREFPWQLAGAGCVGSVGAALFASRMPMFGIGIAGFVKLWVENIVAITPLLITSPSPTEMIAPGFGVTRVNVGAPAPELPLDRS